MLSKEALELLLSQQKKVEVQDIKGYKYSSSLLHLVKEPRTDTIELPTLTAFLAFCEGIDEKDICDYFITAEDCNKVFLFKDEPDSYGQYPLVARVRYSVATGWQDLENRRSDKFIVDLLTKFHENEMQKTLLSIASGIDIEETHGLEDDGMTQKAVTGKAIKTQVRVKNPVYLSPYYSFPEITGVEAPFVFRIDAEDAKKPRMSLYCGNLNLYYDAFQKELSKYISNKVDITVYI